MTLNQQAEKFEREVGIFRTHTEETVNDGLRPFYNEFMSKFAACRKGFAALSGSGLSACLVLDCLWRWTLANKAAKSPRGRKYRSPRYWIRLVNRIEEITDELERVPIIAIDSDKLDTQDTGALVSALRGWSDRLKKSAFTDENRTIFYTLHTNGISFVTPGYEVSATKGRGRKPAAVDYDLSYLAWQFNYWLRRLRPEGPYERESLADVLYTFFDFGYSSDKAHNLSERILNFEKEHAADLNRYKRAATLQVQFAAKLYND
jgi:hypothetical protein